MSDLSRPCIASVGQVGVQLFGVVPRIPADDRPIEMEEISVQVGGSAAIAAGTAAALGCQTRLVCKLADDFAERFVVRALRESGVETRGVLDAERQLSPLSFTAISREGGRRLSFFSRGDAGELEPGEIDPDWILDGAGALLIDGHSPRAQELIAETAKAKQIPIIFDGTEMREGVGTLAALADVIICSERLAGELAPRDSLQRTLFEIQRLGPRAVIITLGSSGCVGLLGNQMIEQPAFATEVIDSTGAGSVFHGAFATATVGALPFAQCIELATAAAALSCRHRGGWAGIPSRSAVVELVRAQPLSARSG